MSSGKSLGEVVFSSALDAISGSNRKRLSLSIFDLLFGVAGLLLLSQGLYSIGYKASHALSLGSLFISGIGGIFALVIGIVFALPSLLNEIVLFFGCLGSIRRFRKGGTDPTEKSPGGKPDISPYPAFVLNLIGLAVFIGLGLYLFL